MYFCQTPSIKIVKYNFHSKYREAFIVFFKALRIQNQLNMNLLNKFSNLYNSLTKTDSGWNRIYDFYLIFGQTDENKFPWITSNWKSDFETYFDALIKKTENSKETGIRALKYIPEKRISKNNEEFIYHSEVKLGRLKWDEKSHEKWTIPDNTEIYFQNFELWTPVWTVCEKKQSPPDIYITISNQQDFENKTNIQFDYFIVIAIAKDSKIDSKTIVKEFSEKINSKATILKTRRWNKPEKAGNWTFRNGIQDTFTSGLYQDKNIQDFEFNELIFEPEWEIIYREK